MKKILLVAASLLICCIASSGLLLSQDRNPTEKPGPQKSGFYTFYNLNSDFGVGVAQISKNTCTTGTSTQPGIYAGNILFDCDGEVPHNETTIAVNPNNPDHALGGYHTYQLNYLGSTVIAHVVGTTSVTFDGGQTWREVTPPIKPFQFSGDPALTFDSNGRVYFASLADHEGPGGNYVAPSLIVSYSDDGGLKWSRPSIVAAGQTAVTVGRVFGPQIFNDKEFIAADASSISPYQNRVYVTWTKFIQNFSPVRFLFQAKIVETHSDDGVNWSSPKEINGFNEACPSTYSGLHDECDLNQDSYPAVAPGGKVYVSFENFNTEAENQVMVVSSSNGGSTWSNPVRVDTLYDINYPSNSDGRDTFTGCQLRQGAKANTATDPSDLTGNTVYVVWGDNRNGGPESTDPTNNDIFLGRSSDGGATWHVFNVDNNVNDQFFPWVSVAPDGRVDVGYMDRSLANSSDPGDQSTCAYGFTLRRLTFDGSGNLSTNVAQRVDTGISDVSHSRWFSSSSNSGARFIGDYNGITVDSLGRTWSLWTDHRNVVANPPSTDRNHGQHAVGALTP